MANNSYQEKRYTCVAIISLSILIIAGLSGCERKKEPIRIGLASTLTGSTSTYGIHVRNGVILAVEQVNRSGGINGRPLELIIRDDKADPDEALRVDLELIESGIVALVGHYTSTLAVRTVPLMNERNILMIGATVSTAKLSGIDDNFIRLMLPVDQQAPLVAETFYEKFGLKEAAVVYDLANPDYSESYYRHFKKEFEKLGGGLSSAITFNSRKHFSAKDIANKITTSGSDSLFIIANATNSATICQHLRNAGSKIKIAASGWAFPDLDFIKNGGQAVEGVFSVTVFNREATSEAFRMYEKSYEERFGEQINMADYLGYEAAQVLIEALSKTDDPLKLKEIILQQSVFNGLDGKIIIDKYGDPVRAMYIEEIRDGAIRIIDKLEP